MVTLHESRQKKKKRGKKKAQQFIVQTPQPTTHDECQRQNGQFEKESNRRRNHRNERHESSTATAPHTTSGLHRCGQRSGMTPANTIHALDLHSHLPIHTDDISWPPPHNRLRRDTKRARKTNRAVTQLQQNPRRLDTHCTSAAAAPAAARSLATAPIAHASTATPASRPPPLGAPVPLLAIANTLPLQGL